MFDKQIVMFLEYLLWFGFVWVIWAAGVLIAFLIIKLVESY